MSIFKSLSKHFTSNKLGITIFNFMIKRSNREIAKGYFDILYNKPYLGITIGSLGFTIYFYRPLPDPCDGNGPIRDNTLISKIQVNESPPLLYNIAQRIIIFMTVSMTRAFLILGGKFNIIIDDNYQFFLDKAISRDKYQSLITVSNHRSMFDDPSILSSLLPYWYNIQPKYLRWNVCSQEFCFNNKIPSLFHAYIGAGKTLPIWRGGGINQKLLWDFATKIAQGEWCHIFPEGGVWQGNTLGGRSNGKEKEFGKLKWGIGKLIAHAPITPIVIPFFHMGMEKVIPQNQKTRLTEGLPIPRPGHNVTLRFGTQIHFNDLIEEHEKIYGKLWKFSSQDNSDNYIENKSKWESKPEDLILYHKITLRIQEHLELLNDTFH